MMEKAASKKEVLQKGGYAYNFDRMVYFNRKTKKVFSVEFVEDHSEKELERCLNEDTNGAEWHFYFNTPPEVPPAVKRELENALR